MINKIKNWFRRIFWTFDDWKKQSDINLQQDRQKFKAFNPNCISCGKTMRMARYDDAKPYLSICGKIYDACRICPDCRIWKCGKVDEQRGRTMWNFLDDDRKWVEEEEAMRRVKLFAFR